MEAHQIAHLRTHKPANIHCESCTRGKLRQVSHRAGSFCRPVKKWGDIVTCDHMIQGDANWQVSCNEERHALSVRDLATGWKWCYPMRGKSGWETELALGHFAGPYKLRLVYSDDSAEISWACRQRKWPHEVSQPGVPQNNGIIERTNGDILAMTRASLIHAGLPNFCWNYACQCVCFNDNCHYSEHGPSAWAKCHGKGEFPGEVLPFGCGVWFLPSPTRPGKHAPQGHTIPKWGGRGCLGILRDMRCLPRVSGAADTWYGQLTPSPP